MVVLVVDGIVVVVVVLLVVLVVVVEVVVLELVLVVVVLLVVVEVVVVLTAGEYVKLAVLKIVEPATLPQLALITYVPATQFAEPPRTKLLW